MQALRESKGGNLDEYCAKVREINEFEIRSGSCVLLRFG